MPFIKNSNIYIYTYKWLFDIAYGRSNSRIYSVFIIKMFGRMALYKRERKSLLKGILFSFAFFFFLVNNKRRSHHHPQHDTRSTDDGHLLT
jgi:uncharacterized membrane protein